MKAGCILYIVFIFLCFQSYSQSIDSSKKSELIDTLLKAGFENLAISENANELILAYENRKYRFTVRGIQQIRNIISPFLNPKQKLILIPQSFQIPLLSVEFPVDSLSFINPGADTLINFDSNVNISYNLKNYWKSLKKEKPVNLSNLKLDIIIYPEFRAQFGDFADPIESQINIAPEFVTSLWPGMQLSYKLIIPLQNDKTFDPEGDKVRPEIVKFNQKFRLPSNIFCSFTTGYFTRHRYGFDFDIRKYTLNGKLSMGCNMGFTGFANLTSQLNTYHNFDKFTCLIDLAYRYPIYDLTFRATYGKFLYDKGLRFDILRQFGEIDFGFYVMKTEIGTNGGFNFTIPISPKKYFNPSRIRISPSSYFNWEYRAKGLPFGGLMYRTGENLDFFLRRYNPDFITKQLKLN